jgi:hypothetical protein
MDYKYIEQLLERYWAAETTLEEERILRRYFLSPQPKPEHLQKYVPWFAALQKDAQPVKATPLTLRLRLMPLVKSAAMLALIISSATITRYTLCDEPEPPQQLAKEKNDSTVEVQVAYEPSLVLDTTRVLEETIK